MAGWPLANRVARPGASPLARELLLAGAMVLVGIGVAGAALLQLAARNAEVGRTEAPAAPPLQEAQPQQTPAITPPPALARPDGSLERPGAPFALPPALAEKAGDPVDK